MVRKTAIVLLLLTVNPAKATTAHDGLYNTGIDGTFLMQVCRADWVQQQAIDNCSALLMGVVDGLVWGRVICPRNGVRNMQLLQLSYDAVKNHPEKWNLSATFVIKERLANLYPCIIK
jgi:hypothetical protein